MEVGVLNRNIDYNFYGKKADKNQAVFSAKTEKKEESVPSDPLSYYKKFCEQFPNISFRLEDEETSRKNPDKICLGYNGSMNQIGENFGGVGHCSINLDISVIRKMQEDPEYEQGMISLIKRTEKMYPSIENDTRSLGMMYTQVTFYDDNGRILHHITMSRQKPSTEEQIRRMWGAGKILGGTGLSFGRADAQETVKRICNQLQDAMLDNFLEMTKEKESE
ncbi:MAG: hypothetical protein K2P76_08895 [Lachnospiraceae bacterium]|nr:hypothetical protein [Lachnospiraceae bacterium]